MRTTFMTMAAVTALSVAVPAIAQPWSGHRSQSGALQMQIDDGLRSGAISHNEVTALRAGLHQLIQLERSFGDNGISGREHALLQQSGNTLRQQINLAERDGIRQSDRQRAAWNDRYDREHRGEWESRYIRDRETAWTSRDGREGERSWNARDGGNHFGANAWFDRSHRGDRFAGDARIGQRTNSRMVALPGQYSEEFRDNDDVYYRYDDKRIYQVDRQTDIILGLLDILN